MTSAMTRTRLFAINRAKYGRRNNLDRRGSAGRADAVLSLLFGPVERTVRDPQKLVARLTHCVLRDSEARGDPQLVVAGSGERAVGERTAQALGRGRRACEVRLGEQQGELLASQPPGHVDVAHVGEEKRREPL